MKNASLLLLLTLITFSCEDTGDLSTENNLVGTWVLIAKLDNPDFEGNTFEIIESDLQITFNLDRSFVANGAICAFESSLEVDGHYSLTDPTINSSDGTIRNYSLIDDELIIECPCDGTVPCLRKYGRL